MSLDKIEDLKAGDTFVRQDGLKGTVIANLGYGLMVQIEGKNYWSVVSYTLEIKI